MKEKQTELFPTSSKKIMSESGETYFIHSHEPHYNGPEYKPSLDFVRLQKQTQRVRDAAWKQWKTLEQISMETGDPQSSVSAQLRHLRKPRFGGYLVERRRVENYFEYRVSKNGSYP